MGTGSERARGFVSVYNSIRRTAKPGKTFLRLLRSILYVCLSATHRFARHWPLRVLHYSYASSVFRVFHLSRPPAGNPIAGDRLTNRVKISRLQEPPNLSPGNYFFTMPAIDVRFGSSGPLPSCLLGFTRAPLANRMFAFRRFTTGYTGWFTRMASMRTHRCIFSRCIFDSALAVREHFVPLKHRHCFASVAREMQAGWPESLTTISSNLRVKYRERGNLGEPRRKTELIRIRTNFSAGN